jgi:predicted glycogen debranching enzyme
LETSLPKIHLSQNILSNFDKAIQTEWIITNGLGGYSSSTVLGINTRKYHGVLVAAFNPPTDRRVLLTKLDEEVRIDNNAYSLGSNEFKNGIFPRGYAFLSSFSLNPFPTYKYAVHGIQIEKTLFMPYEKNAVIISYELFNPLENEISVNIFPLVNSRHFHSLTKADELDWSFIQKKDDEKVKIQTSKPLSTLLLSARGGQYFLGKGEWIRGMYFRVDDAMGYDCFDDVFQPGKFEFKVASKGRKKFHILAVGGEDEEEVEKIFSSIFKESGDIDVLYDRELKRLKGLLSRFQKRYVDVEMEDWLKWLLLAADSFIVHRKSVQKKSVIAGYHWFEDWGRDSLISLPGLTLVTGRFDDAREILLTFKQYCTRGVVPNRFPDSAGDKPEYNTVDASLWYFNAVLQFLKYTGDFEFIRRELWDTLQSIIEHHVKGTMYNIHVDSDGLLAHGPQLTWMDAVVGDKAVTPREGRAVEIQALWYNALRVMELLARQFNQIVDVEKYAVMAEKAKKSFNEQFWDGERGFLADVVNDSDKDWCLRPNQLIASALDFCMLDKTKCKSIVDVVQRKLWGKYGCRTVDRVAPLYIGRYESDWARRNRAYHNGTVWAWLTGPFVTGFLKVYGYSKERRDFAFENFLKPLFLEEVYRAGLGTVSEIFDGDEPHLPRGCISQAWSVAEPLRAYIEDITQKKPPHEQKILENLVG